MQNGCKGYVLKWKSKNIVYKYLKNASRVQEIYFGISKILLQILKCKTGAKICTWMKRLKIFIY